MYTNINHIVTAIDRIYAEADLVSNKRSLSTLVSGVVAGNILSLPSTPISVDKRLSLFDLENIFGKTKNEVAFMLEDINEVRIISIPRAMSIAQVVWSGRVCAVYPYINSQSSLIYGGISFANLISEKDFDPENYVKFTNAAKFAASEVQLAISKIFDSKNPIEVKSGN